MATRSTQSKEISERRFWRLLLVALVVLPLLPEITTLAVSEIAELRGCHLGDETACATGSMWSPTTIIRLALNVSYLVSLSFGSGAVAVWLVVCYVSITQGWTHLVSRLTLGFLVSLIFGFVPFFAPMISVGRLVNPNCQPNEGGIGPCVAYGGDVGNIVHYNIALAWEVLTSAPVALGAFVLYCLFLFLSIAQLALARRAVPSV